MTAPTTAPDIDSPPQGLVGQNIVCFAKDWREDPTSCNHVLRELAKRNNVLWVNSISTRAPSLASGRDIRKIFRKLMEFTQGAKQVEERMWLFTPFVLPFHNRPWAIRLNRLILRATLAVIRRRLGMRDFQLWTFVPTSSEYVGRLGESAVIYYCTDEWSAFSFVDAARMSQMVASLAGRADVVFATSQPLVDKLHQFNDDTYLASHGVKYQMFSRALEADVEVPADLAALPHPVLGFYGLIEEWLDQGLLAYLARKHPEWSIVLVGKVCVDVATLTALPNVHFLGRKPHEELPAYCKGFDVALIPHKVNDLTRSMNPIKLREYLSAGLQIVSTDLPEMRRLPDLCVVADTYEAFEAGVQTCLRADSPAVRRQRSRSMSTQTWDRKVAEIGATILRVMGRTSGTPANTNVR